MIYKELEALWDQEQALQKKICRIKIELHTMREEGEVSDVVTGTRKDGIIGRIKISGIQTDRLLQHEKKLKAAAAELMALQNRIDQKMYEAEWEICKCNDPETRLLLRWRYLDRLSWADIGMRHGKVKARCHKIVQDYLLTLSEPA